MYDMLNEFCFQTLLFNHGTKHSNVNKVTNILYKDDLFV